MSWDDNGGIATVNFNAVGMQRLAARVEQQRPCLLEVSGRRSLGRLTRIDGELTLGRALGSDLVLDEDGVSRRHARVVASPDGTVQLEDLGSSNGTLVNGELVARREIVRGDIVQLGNAMLTLVYMDDPVADGAAAGSIADVDATTGLATHAALMRALDASLRPAQGYESPVALLIIGIDRFKRLSDAHGERAAASVLQRVADIVEESVQIEDKLLARYGHEELALLLSDASPEDALTCAGWIQRGVESSSFVVGAERVVVTLTVGLAHRAGHATTRVDDFVDEAERSFYAARLRTLGRDGR